MRLTEKLLCCCIQDGCARRNILDMFVAETRFPTWPTLFDQVLEEEGGIAFAGVCSSLEAALRLKELYEDETVTQYRAKSTVATFGRTKFQRTALRRATFRLMDVRLYTPIFILAKNRYICHKGPDIDRGLKEKRKRAHLSGGYHSGDEDINVKNVRTKKRKIHGGLGQVTKRQRHSQLSKKVGCPAALTMYEVLIANCEDADFDDELSWKVRIATQEIELQRFIVVFLPHYHEGHEIGHSSASCVSRSWHPDVRAKLTSLLGDGVHDPDEMLGLLKLYVETSLCATYVNKPHTDDRRYYPLRTDIRNAIAYDLKEKKVRVKPDGDKSMFQQWAETGCYVFYRPDAFSEVDGQQNLLLVYQSSNQQHLFRRYGTELLFVDESTTCGIHVFFVSVKTNCICQVVAFFLSTVSSVEIITEGLAMLRNWNPDVEPRYVMCDQDDKHFAAVEATWPNAHLLLCDFCREQDWTRWLSKEEVGLMQYTQDILTHLRQIAGATSEEELSAAENRLANDSIYIDSLPLQLYFTQRYLPFVTRWVQCYRLGLHTRVDASNANERRGGPVQKHYQQASISSGAVDVVSLAVDIKLTMDIMWQDYHKANVAQATSNVDVVVDDAVSHLANRPHTFCNFQLKAYQKAKHFLQQCTDVTSYIKRQENDMNTFLVRDFNSVVNQWYRVELTGDPSCTCGSFHKHKMPCSHFYAVFAIFSDVSWKSLPAEYRDLSFFTLDPRCVQFPEDDSARSNDSELARSSNINRLTGLLDKIKASAGTADDSSLSSCVQQVEAAATLVENASPKHSMNGKNSLAESCARKSAFASISPKKSTSRSQLKSMVSRRSITLKPHELTLDSQRLQQQRYAATVKHNERVNEMDAATLGDAWILLDDIIISQQQHRAMIAGEELDDSIVSVSLALLRAEDHDGRYSGLLAPSRLSAIQFEGRHDENLVQLMKVVSDKAPRWICVSTVGRRQATVDIYDCALPSGCDEEDAYPHAVKMQIAALITSPLDQQTITLHLRPVSQREGTIASGLLAVAFATDLVYYQTIVGKLDQQSLASHLEACLTSGRLVPFPKLDANGSGRLSRPLKLEIPVYCKCRLPYTENRDSDEDLMVMCSADDCRIQFYHLRCVGATDLERQRARDCSWQCDLCADAALCKL